MTHPPQRMSKFSRLLPHRFVRRFRSPSKRSWGQAIPDTPAGDKRDPKNVFEEIGFRLRINLSFLEWFLYQTTLEAWYGQS